jgi:N-methylhydantoinase B
VLYTWQGGGGYGDPLARDPALVQRDRELGMISRGRAREVYGVPGDRESLRQARLARAEPPAVPSAAAPGVPVTRIGLSLKLARGPDGAQIECQCGQVLASGEGNWKDGAATRRLGRAELPPGIVVHSTLELVSYLCPACGRQHSVEVQELGVPALHDLRVKDR